MFSTEDLKVLDPKYFSVIAVDAYDVTIMSRNTGHIWYIHSIASISSTRSGKYAAAGGEKHQRA